VAIDARYYLPYRASAKLGYRHYTDSWGIVSNNGDLEYVHPIGNNWTVEGTARYYTQKHADFYSDLFPFIDAQNFLARDKLLSTFSDWSVRLGGSWNWHHTPKVSSVISAYVDHYQYNFQDFRDATVKASPGSQPLYSYERMSTWPNIPFAIDRAIPIHTSLSCCVPDQFAPGLNSTGTLIAADSTQIMWRKPSGSISVSAADFSAPGFHMTVSANPTALHSTVRCPGSITLTGLTVEK
jgi:hypothetical protein